MFRKIIIFIGDFIKRYNCDSLYNQMNSIVVPTYEVYNNVNNFNAMKV